jgi:hypothetical protein
MSERRGLSSVADVSLALVLVVASVGVFVAFLNAEETDHDPTGAAHTAETLGASTLNVTYSLEPVLETDSEHVPAVGDENASYDAADLERSTHGSTMGHVARAALANARFAPDQGGVSPLAVGDRFAETLDTRLLVSLVGANFATNVTAVWEPFDGSDIRGTASFGEPVPHEAQRSVVRTTVPSELPPAREEALAAVGTESEDYQAVARRVAAAIVEGTLGDTQRELETDSAERAVVVSRYLRFADAIDGVSRDDLGDDLARSSADAAALTAQLVDGLAAELTAELDSRFDSAGDAARAVSTGEVTVSITTWTR